jgi:hypothetical protein
MGPARRREHETRACTVTILVRNQAIGAYGLVQ